MADERDTAAPIVVGSVAGAIAFAAYTKTLLRTVELGDTGGFQAAITSPDISARQAYPLFFAVARPFTHLVAPDNPALGLNLFSAFAGAMAVGVLAMVTALVTGSAATGAVSALLLAFSYTWWHQAIIAEVYTLHLLLVGLCLVALWAYKERATTRRLAVFFAVYAGAFGNHLSMILLLAPFATFLLASADRRARLLTPRSIGLAAAIGIAGALQYLPGFIAVRNSVGAPDGLAASAAAFWFDVTKADWRESMLLGVRESELIDHLAMAIFDARQQFGIAGLALAAAGLAWLWMHKRAWAVLCLAAYAINTGFAITYNVGDPHVFFLPGHYITALCAGAALMWGRMSPASPAGTEIAGGGRSRLRRAASTALAIVALGYAAWRGYDTWPAADRHNDGRAQEIVDRLTDDIDEREAVLVADLDWQIENALRYGVRVDFPNVAWVRMNDVLPHFPFFVDANHASHRDVVVTARGASRIESSFGPLFTLAPQDMPQTIADAVDLMPAGTVYVLAVLTPPRGQPIEAPAMNAIVSALTGARVTALKGGHYELLVGRAGRPPSMTRSSNRPFRGKTEIGGASVEVRMDGWLPTETFRRGGFGHLIRNHAHAMTLERGVNLMWFSANGTPSRPYYANGVYAPQARFRIPANAPGLAQLR